MKLILKQDVEKLGAAGDLVDVKPGYGRNYLIPQGLAEMATEGAIRDLEHRKEQAEARAELTVEAAKDLADTLETTSVTIPVKTGEEGKIFGTITNQDVADALAERDITVDRRKISIDQDVKELGEYTATINLLGDLKPQIKIWVVKGD